ncbi:hypothetical protein ABZ958_33495 [Streptomyces sp. NPDC046237]|uniref:TetR/AcrR family transcriptional regulator n=1 Tax=Streptomyces sp. NPDC046237 TaxID=3154914 RepID=UPI0033F06BA1
MGLTVRQSLPRPAPGELPAALAPAYLDRWDRLPADDPWPALIRSAVSHPPSAELLRTILEKQVGELSRISSATRPTRRCAPLSFGASCSA